MQKMYKEVSKKKPCKICQKTSWCSYSLDDAVSICRRIHTENGIKRNDRNGDEYTIYFEKNILNNTRRVK